MRLFLIALLCGCLGETAEIVPCGETACAAGDVCTASGCASPEEVTSCAASAEGAACTTSTVDRGACRGGACRLAVCGDGLVELDEICDDDNNVSGDGCSADCKSTEACGNGVVDPVNGEECDDGNYLSNDGCSSRCKRELPTWQDVSPSPIAGREGHAIAYDAGRGVFVAFGGETATDYLNDTWEWDGMQWTPRAPLVSPPRRAYHAMMYDSVRHVVVMVGGTGDAGGLGDTWTWDGTSWTEVTGTTGPGGRVVTGAFVFDDQRGVGVLFDGETWEWDGAVWMRRAISNPPVLGLLAYDSARHVSVLYAPSQTWEYDGATWTQSAAGSPTISGAALAYDRSIARTVLYGGYGTDQTFEWDGSQWLESIVLPRPPARTASAMAYDSRAHRLMLFGGGSYQNSTLTVYADTWTRAASAWSQVPNAAVAPTPRISAVAAYDPARGNVLLVGGWDTDTGAITGDLWQWRGGIWRQRGDAGSIPPRLLHAGAFDSQRGKLVVFGGFAFGSSPYGDTWEWDDTQWVQKSPAIAPPPRHGAAMAYDAAHGVVVLFGGVGSALYGDTWTWDGTTWTNVTPAVSPPARGRAALAYDPVRARVVLFGGCTNTFGATGCFDDTWEWDGAAWTQIAASGPTAREQASLAYDAQRRRIVMTSGYSMADSQLGDIWEWDGRTWAQLATEVRPAIRDSAAMAYDARARELVVFGGDGITGSLGDTWVFHYAAPLEPVERCVLPTADDDGDGLAGCADPDCWGSCAPLCPPGTSCE